MVQTALLLNFAYFQTILATNCLLLNFASVVILPQTALYINFHILWPFLSHPNLDIFGQFYYKLPFLQFAYFAVIFATNCFLLNFAYFVAIFATNCILHNFAYFVAIFVTTWLVYIIFGHFCHKLPFVKFCIVFSHFCHKLNFA